MVLKVLLFIVLLPFALPYFLFMFIKGMVEGSKPKKNKPKPKKNKQKKDYIDHYEEALAFLDDKK